MKMKSSSSSPSSSFSFSSKSHTFGCISLILQRLLCSGTSSRYPSDQITERSYNSPDLEPSRDRGDEPGAVARLMGLDSVPKSRGISRSRSVNSVDCLKRDKVEIQGKHRRVKSSLEYVELEHDHFFILSFEDDKKKKGFGELKQLGTRKCRKRREIRENQTRVEDKENNINAMNVSPGRERLEIRELKQCRKEKRNNRRKRREIKLRQNMAEYENENWVRSYAQSKAGDSVKCEVRSVNEEEEEECGSCEELSPVSVLDYDRFTENNSRRRLCPELESKEHKETIQEDHITLMSRESNVQHHDHQEMWLKICRLTVSEIEGSNWFYRKASKVEDFEGTISEDLASNILDQLLEETITTLSLTSQV